VTPTVKESLEVRDPRTDPRPGDVLLIGPQWQNERYEVVSTTTERIGYNRFLDTVIYRRGDGATEHMASFSDWREWAATAEVVRRGDA
jgi:hypothetical protein